MKRFEKRSYNRAVETPALITAVRIFPYLQSSLPIKTRWALTSLSPVGYGLALPSSWSHPTRKHVVSFLLEWETAPLQGCPIADVSPPALCLISDSQPHLTPCWPGFSSCLSTPTLTTRLQSPRPLLPGPGSSLCPLGPTWTLLAWEPSLTTTFRTTMTKSCPPSMINLRAPHCSTTCPVRK